MKNGLSNEQVEESRRLHGSNKLPEPELKKWYHFAKEALTEPITMILIIIALFQLVFDYLKSLDGMKGRKHDNTGFTAVKDMNKMSDEQLYTEILRQYKDWLNKK